MPRLRTVESQADPDGVPEALFDYRSDVWASDRAARAWCGTHDLAKDVIRDSPVRGRERQRRRSDALCGWALANGFASPEWPVMPDWRRLATLGLVAAGSPNGRRGVTGRG